MTSATLSHVDDRPNVKEAYANLSRIGRDKNAVRDAISTLQAGGSNRPTPDQVTERLLAGLDVSFEPEDEGDALAALRRKEEALEAARKVAERRLIEARESASAEIVREYQTRIAAARQRAVSAFRELGAARREQSELLAELMERGARNADVGIVPAAAMSSLEAWLVSGRGR